MIRRILAFILFATLSHTWLLATEENETISPNTTSPTIGILFDAGIPNHKFDSESYGASIFFKKRLRQPIQSGSNYSLMQWIQTSKILF